ncbi:MAG: SufE family protein [Ignavibacteria bacterium]|nr:SufE family protein [Ignavibacteria bacterium]
MTIKEIQQEIIEEFSMLDDWDSKYEYIIELGKQQPPLPDKDKTEENKVSGCQSQVWLKTEFKDGKLIFNADSDAIITKGLIALLIRVFNNQKPEDIYNSDITFLEEIGLMKHLSPNRSNGLLSMVKRIKMEAQKHLNKN